MAAPKGTNMPLQFILTREPTTSKGTAGVFQILVDGKEVAKFYSLEDPVRDVKVWGDTAIPKGTYKVGIRYSNRFKKKLPSIKDVPGFEGILIHGGNTKEDTHGCILLGTKRISTASIPKIAVCAPAVAEVLRTLKEHGDTAELTIQ